MTTSSRTCQQCGEVLLPDQTFCHSCGTPYFESPQVEPTRLASSTGTNLDAEQTSVSPTSMPSAIPASPSGMPLYGNTAYGLQGSGYTPPPLPHAEADSSGRAYASLPPPVVSYSRSVNSNGQQSAGIGQASSPKAKKGPKAAVILAVVFLLLMLIGGGFFLVTKTINGQSAVTPPSPSAAGLQTQIATQSASQALFSDNFTNNDNAWDTTSGSGYTRAISNNELTLTDANHKILIETLPTNNTYADLMLTVSFTLVQADQNDSVGLYVRGDSNLDHDYRVDIFGDNSYAISKEYLDGTTVKIKPIVDPTRVSELNPAGQQNTVSLIARESTLILVINNKVVNTVTDTDYTNGQAAIFVQNGDTSKGVKAMFSSVAIYPAPQQLPG